MQRGRVLRVIVCLYVVGLTPLASAVRPNGVIHETIYFLFAPCIARKRREQ